MIVSLTGVFQDGSALLPGVPSNPRTPIHSQIGGSLTVQLRVVRPTGAPLNAIGNSFLMTAKLRPQDQPPAFQVAGMLTPSLGPNWVTFTVAPANTKLLAPGRYGYDIWMTDPAGNRDAVMPYSPLILEPAATPSP